VVKEVRQQKTLAAAASAREKLTQAAQKATEGLPEVPGPGELDVAKLKDALASRALGVGGGGKSSRSVMRETRAAARAQQSLSHDRPRDPPRDEVPAETAARANAVDVRGKRADEALSEVEAFLDRAALQGADTVMVIHGHGTGALRRTVREYLATSPYVDRFRPGGAGEGGDGVSVVSLRG
jgi:hypothetical protein